MAFIGIGPVVNKVVEKSVEFVPIIGPGLKYVKTAKKIEYEGMRDSKML